MKIRLVYPFLLLYCLLVGMTCASQPLLFTDDACDPFSKVDTVTQQILAKADQAQDVKHWGSESAQIFIGTSDGIGPNSLILLQASGNHTCNCWALMYRLDAWPNVDPQSATPIFMADGTLRRLTVMQQMERTIQYAHNDLLTTRIADLRRHSIATREHDPFVLDDRWVYLFATAPAWSYCKVLRESDLALPSNIAVKAILDGVLNKGCDGIKR